MPEVLRLLNPFNFNSAFDVTDIPIRGDTLGMLITLSESEVQFFSPERLETCWVYVGNPNVLHTYDGRPLPSQVFNFNFLIFFLKLFILFYFSKYFLKIFLTTSH